MNEDEDFDIDLWQYDYWNDIDYGSDGDEIRQRQLDSRRTKKRKLTQPLSTQLTTSPSSNKKRKVLPAKGVKVVKQPTGKARSMDELPSVVLMKKAVEQRYEAQEIPTVDVKPLVPVGLLGDWREKFKNAPMWTGKTGGVTLEEVHDAPDDDGGSEDTGEEIVDEDAEEGWEDEDEDGDGEEGGGMDLQLDPEALKMAIQQNLQAAGINVKGMDEQTIMAMAMKMFAGGSEEGAGDDMIGEMAEQLLGGCGAGDAHDDDESAAATEDEETGFAGWVHKQAQAKATAKDKREHEHEHDLPTPTDSTGKPSASPPEKVKPAGKSERQEMDVEVEAEAEAGAEQDIALEKTRGTKRKADSAAVEDKGAKRTANARRFDAPTAASKARSVSSTTKVPVAAVSGKKKGRKG